MKASAPLIEEEAFLSLAKERFAAVSLFPSASRLSLFYRLYARLVEENEKKNLTAITDAEGVLLLHFIDSLAPLFPALKEFSPKEGARLIDVGAGAGFPTLPLAILREDLAITALDATEKKVAFIRDMAEELGLPGVTPLAGRAELLAKGELREAFDLATARAVASLPVLLELTAPFVKKGGLILAMKGPGAEEEIARARHAAGELKCKVIFTKEYQISDGVAKYDRTMILLRKTGETPFQFPRPYAKITGKPL